MKPALTKEEWAGEVQPPHGNGVVETTYGSGVGLDTGGVLNINGYEYEYAGERRHALAALALHGQPFGFTREDVLALRHMADVPVEDEGAYGEGWRSRETVSGQERLASLADRIKALLPPEEP